MQASEQIARHIAAYDEVALHIFYRKFAAQGVFGKHPLRYAHFLQFLRANVAQKLAVIIAARKPLLSLPAKIPGRPFKKLVRFSLRISRAARQLVCVLDEGSVKFRRSLAVSYAVRAEVFHVRPQ